MALAVRDRPTESVSDIRHLPFISESPAASATTPTFGPSAATWTTAESPNLSENPVAAAPTTVVSISKRTDLEFGALLVWLAVVGALSRRRQLQKTGEPMDPAAAVERIKGWTGLSVAGIAELLGVARRSLYHWTAGATRPRQEAALLGLVRALEPFSGSVEPWELRRWLEASEAQAAVRAGDAARLHRLLADALRSSSPRALRPARAGYREEVEPLSPADLQRHFLSSSPSREARQVARIRPLELTDSPIAENE